MGIWIINENMNMTDIVLEWVFCLSLCALMIAFTTKVISSMVKKIKQNLKDDYEKDKSTGKNL